MKISVVVLVALISFMVLGTDRKKTSTIYANRNFMSENFFFSNNDSTENVKLCLDENDSTACSSLYNKIKESCEKLPKSPDPSNLMNCLRLAHAYKNQLLFLNQLEYWIVNFGPTSVEVQQLTERMEKNKSFIRTGKWPYP